MSTIYQQINSLALRLWLLNSVLATSDKCGEPFLCAGGEAHGTYVVGEPETGVGEFTGRSSLVWLGSYHGCHRHFPARPEFQGGLSFCAEVLPMYIDPVVILFIIVAVATAAYEIDELL